MDAYRGTHTFVANDDAVQPPRVALILTNDPVEPHYNRGPMPAYPGVRNPGVTIES